MCMCSPEGYVVCLLMLHLGVYILCLGTPFSMIVSLVLPVYVHRQVLGHVVIEGVFVHYCHAVAHKYSI